MRTADTGTVDFPIPIVRLVPSARHPPRWSESGRRAAAVHVVVFVTSHRKKTHRKHTIKHNNVSPRRSDRHRSHAAAAAARRHDYNTAVLPFRPLDRVHYRSTFMNGMGWNTARWRKVRWTERRCDAVGSGANRRRTLRAEEQ